MAWTVCTVLAVVCVVLVIVCAVMGIKIYLLRKSCDEMLQKLDLIISDDTNTVTRISSDDRKMKRFAEQLNKKLKKIRKEQLRYINGDKELKNAITNISHDLRTPLTAIMGYLDLMENVEKSEKLRQYLAIIRGRAESMKDLTEELFRYSVVLCADVEKTASETVVNKVLEDSLMSFYAALSEKGIAVSVDMTEQKIVRTLNADSLSRVFANLFNNALKYSDGDLDITLSEPCVITFSNQASQLTVTQVERLFDRFYTVEMARSSTGLGLSIARTLIEQMGGTISAGLEDERLTITIRL
jgi:signal transduction histidine kinase